MKKKAISTDGRAALRRIDRESMDTVFRSVGQKLREGLSGDAEHILTDTIGRFEHKPDDLAHLQRLLSFTLETAGRYQESLDAIIGYENSDRLEPLASEPRLKLVTQLAIAYNNSGDQPKAVTLLKENLDNAERDQERHLYGSINIALARVYRKLAEFPICRDYAQKALEQFRDYGDWLGMAEAYREIANSHHQEGHSEKALDSFKQGIGIIGENSAPFMLGKLYTDMSGAYWFLRRPLEGIECLERSIEFFDQTAHALNSVIAYNNLGINLVLIGNWERAEKMIRRALEIAEREGYVHVAGIYDSLGELYILRGELDEALSWLKKAVSFATEKKHEWYTVQSMQNLARCFLAKGDADKAIAKATETIERCREIGDKHYANMAGLVLAEAHIEKKDTEKCDEAILSIEESDPSSDFFVLGNIQRIRGLAALVEQDVELAVHHFSRALTVFQTAEDVYHTGLINYLLGVNLDEEHHGRALRHLETAAQTFQNLGLNERRKQAEKVIERRKAEHQKSPAPSEKRTNSVVTQLLTVRLAEATASRELLFRELVAVLTQESGARRIIIAHYNDQKRLVPFITHGITPQDSNDLISKLTDAQRKNDEKNFIRTRNLAQFSLRGTAASPAVLLISPQNGAVLNDGSSIAPLLRVVELGMDVIALRERDRSQPDEAESVTNSTSNVLPGFIHSSPAMTALVEEVYKIRSSDVTVLVTGESGTGKELVSQAIHKLSNRKEQTFTAFNCTGLTKELADATLFGYKKGSYTGATADNPGIIRAADHGTLFLDEIGDLPLDFQPKLLRFLQEGEIHPLGENRPIKVDVRVIAATNVALEEKVAQGTFREDLYYRLNVIRLQVPPLRDRRSEIPPMVNYYINHYSERFGKRNISITPQAIDMLMVANWEGNVRELCNEVARFVARSVDGAVIRPDDLSPHLRRNAKPLSAVDGEPNVKPIATYDGGFTPFANIQEGGTLESAVSELEMQLIRSSLSRHNWNISRVAGELGLTRRGLYLKLTRYGIQKVA